MRNVPRFKRLVGGTVKRVVFEPNGEAQITGAGKHQDRRRGRRTGHEIEINEATSRIKVVQDILMNVC